MRKILLLTLFGCMGTLLHAQPKLPPNYFWRKLPNGLEVVVIENNRVPLATIEMAVKNGAYTEGPEFSGLSHLFEHMFFKANKDYPNQEQFIARTEELGMIWNGTTSDERVNYYFTFDRDSLEAGLKFMNAAMRFPIYRAEDMQKERPVVDGEFQRAESDPGFQLWYEMGKRLWGELFTRKNPIGDHDVINTATPQKMMTIKDKYYYPNNSILVVAGDVQHDKAFALAEQIYGDWQHSGFDPNEKFPIPEFKPLTQTQYFVKESAIAQTPYIMMAWHGPDTRNDSAATLAADLFSAAVKLNSSKLQQALVDKGLAAAVDISYQTNKYVGPISLYVLPNPAKMKECYSELMKQIAQFSDPAYLTDEQIQTAKDNMIRNDIRSKEKPSTLSMSMTYWWCSASLDFYTNYISNLQKVTRQDITNYVNKYIKGKPYVAGLIISPEMNKDLKAAEFFTTKDL